MKRMLLFLIINFIIFENLYAQKPLKILFMLNCFPALSATFVIGQITGLIDRGHDVSIFAYRKTLEKKNHPDVKHYKLLERTYFKSFPKDIVSYDILYCQFFSTAKRFLPEIIRLKETSKKTPKVIVCCRGNDGVEYVNKRDKKFQQLITYADLFLPVCKNFKNYLVQAGCNPYKVIIHYSAIDLKKFRYKEPEIRLPDREIILLSVGRLAESKGFEYAIHAFEKLQKEFSQLRYIIIGDGPLRTKLETLIRQYNLTAKVSLLGWRTQDEIIEFLNKAHIFLHPAITSSRGHQEGIPNVIMEAMATGLPIIATQHGGIPEIVVDGLSGFLVPEKSIKNLKEKTKYLIHHTNLWKNFATMARLHVENVHNIEVENNRLEKLFFELLAN